MTSIKATQTQMTRCSHCGNAFVRGGHVTRKQVDQGDY